MKMKTNKFIILYNIKFKTNQCCKKVSFLYKKNRTFNEKSVTTLI